MIKIQCACGKQLECPDDKAGKRGRCPFCRAVIVMPAAPVDPFRYATFCSVEQEASIRKAHAEGRLKMLPRQGERKRVP